MDGQDRHEAEGEGHFAQMNMFMTDNRILVGMCM